MLLKELLHLFLLEFTLVFIIAFNGISPINTVILLSKELFEGQHHVTCCTLGPRNRGCRLSGNASKKGNNYLYTNVIANGYPGRRGGTWVCGPGGGIGQGGLIPYGDIIPGPGG